MLKKHLQKTIQRATRFYYLQKLCFGSVIAHQTFGTATTSPPKLNLLRLEEELSQAHLRLSRVFIENLPWKKVIEKYDRPHTLFFCDPPYFELEGYGIDFKLEQYQQLADYIKSIKGKMIITLNNHLKILDQTTAIEYTVSRQKTGKKSQELIISNFDVGNKDGR